MKNKIDIDIKAFHQECLKIMDAFDAVCRREGLRYYMACGTMLGAVRHKGFIPWDDDVDVFMPRPDFEKLKEHASEWLPENLKLIDNTTDITFPHFFAKIEDINTSLIERVYLGHFSGFWIDIFIIDGMTSDKKKREKHIRNFNFWRKLQYFVYRDAWKHGKTVGGALVWLVQKCFSKQYVNGKVRRIAMQYDFDKYDLLMPHCDECKTFTKDTLGLTPVEYDYEGRKYWGVKDYDTYLKSVYGDYMTFPPKEQQVSHHDLVYCDVNMPVAEYVKRFVEKK